MMPSRARRGSATGDQRLALSGQAMPAQGLYDIVRTSITSARVPRRQRQALPHRARPSRIGLGLPSGPGLPYGARASASGGARVIPEPPLETDSESTARERLRWDLR